MKLGLNPSRAPIHFSQDQKHIKHYLQESCKYLTFQTSLSDQTTLVDSDVCCKFLAGPGNSCKIFGRILRKMSKN